MSILRRYKIKACRRENSGRVIPKKSNTMEQIEKERKDRIREAEKISDYACRILNVDYDNDIYVSASLILGALILAASVVSVMVFNLVTVKPFIPVGSALILYSFVRMISVEVRSSKVRSSSEYVLTHNTRKGVKYTSFIYMDGEEPRAVPIRDLEINDKGECVYRKLPENTRIHCISLTGDILSSSDYYNGHTLDQTMRKYISTIDGSTEENIFGKIGLGASQSKRSLANSSKKED
jgi:hypothetical protein